MFKRLLYLTLSIILLVGAAAPAQGGCIIVQSARCDSTWSNPSCPMQSGSTCMYDASGCRSSCGGGTGWDDCDPETRFCIENQIP